MKSQQKHIKQGGWLKNITKKCPLYLNFSILFEDSK